MQTGGQFDSEIQAAGNFADQQIDQQLGGQGQGGLGQGGQGQDQQQGW